MTDPTMVSALAYTQAELVVLARVSDDLRVRETCGHAAQNITAVSNHLSRAAARLRSALDEWKTANGAGDTLHRLAASVAMASIAAELVDKIGPDQR